MRNIIVYIADGNRIMREAVKSILSGNNLVSVAGESGRGDIALNDIKALAPDLAIIDMSISVVDCLTMVKILRNVQPGLKIIVLSMSRELEYLDSALSSGINGYLLKEEAENLPGAILKVIKGEKYLSPLLLGLYNTANNRVYGHDEKDTVC